MFWWRGFINLQWMFTRFKRLRCTSWGRQEVLGVEVTSSKSHIRFSVYAYHHHTHHHPPPATRFLATLCRGAEELNAALDTPVDPALPRLALLPPLMEKMVLLGAGLSRKQTKKLETLARMLRVKLMTEYRCVRLGFMYHYRTLATWLQLHYDITNATTRTSINFSNWTRLHL